MPKLRAMLVRSLLIIFAVAMFAGCQQMAQPFIESGNAKTTEKNYEQAVADFSRAIKIDPGSAQAYTGRGRIYNIQKQYDLALTDLNRSIELDPNLATAYYYRGLCHKALGQKDKAIADFESAAKFSEDDSLAALIASELTGLQQ